MYDVVYNHNFDKKYNKLSKSGTHTYGHKFHCRYNWNFDFFSKKFWHDKILLKHVFKTYCQWLTFRGILARISSFLSFVIFAMKRNYPYIQMIALIDIFILKEQHLKIF